MNLLARRRLIERLRVYLRRHDFIQGYLPQLVMEEQASEWWCLLWYCVRYLDTLIDSPIEETDPDRLLAKMLASDGDFGQALRLFLEETAGRVPRRLLNEMYEGARLERRYFSDGRPQSAARYLALVDRKAVIPVYICALLNGIDADHQLMASFTTNLGRAAQLMDDLLDLRVDLAEGRIFVTCEELAILGLTAEDIPSHTDRIALLRAKWVMEISWLAYEAANQLRDNNFALLARSWIESIWKLVAEGKAVPLDRAILKDDLFYAHYVGASPLLFDLAPTSELLKYQLVHRPFVTFLKHYKLLDLSSARRAYERLRVDLGPLWAATGFGRPCANPASGGRAPPDPRQLIDLDEGLGLPRLQREVPWIFLTMLTDLGGEVAEDLAQGNLAGAVVDLVADAVDYQHAVEQERLRRTHERIVGALPDDRLALRGLIELGLDCLSLVGEHQRAFQRDILTWMEQGSIDEEL